MNIYQTVLFAILEPIFEQDNLDLEKVVKELKQTSGEKWAVGEMLERAMRFIYFSQVLIEEQKKK